MKNKAIAFFAFLLYRVVFSEPKKYGENYKWTFKMKPRKINLAVLIFILSPLIILISGITGVIETIKRCFKTEAWSSYEFILPAGVKPSKYMAYLKF